MSQTATIVPTAAIFERWEATTPVTGDYARDCAELAREALSHVGFTRFEETPFEDVLACREGDLPVTVTVAVLPVPVESFEMTLDDLQSLIDDDVVAHGAALCVGRALTSDGPLPERLRFDVVSVYVKLDAGACASTTSAGRGSRSHEHAHHASEALAIKTGAFLLC